MTSRRRAVLLALVAIGAAVPFLPALTAPFLEWDDLVVLSMNPRWRGFSAENIRWMLTTMFGGPYQPLSWLSYALDHTLWGANPAAMRATNLALHGASAALLFMVADDLIKRAAPRTLPSDRTAAALFGALLWAVHPLRVESVVWLTERRDVLSGLLYLLAVWLYLRDPEKPLRPLSAFCLAVLAKASVVTLPLTLLVLDRWPLRRRALTEKLPYLAVACAAGVAALVGQSEAGTLKGAEVGAGERLALAIHSLWWYAAKTLWPAGLSPHHRVPSGFGLGSPLVWGAALAVLAAAGAAWAVRRRAPAVPAALILYAIALAPMSGLVRFGGHLVAERYSYLPGLPLAVLAGAGLLAARGRQRWRAPAAAAAALLILGNAAMTARGALHWSGTEALWRRAIAVDPGATAPRVRLAAYYRRANLIDQALAEERAAVAIDPGLAEPLTNLGADALGRKDFAEAERILRAAVAADPGLATARYNLAGALSGLGRHGEALSQLEQAARIDFSDAKILNNLGVALSRAGKHARAEAALRRAAELAPEWPAPRHNLGNALTALGREREAREAYEKAVRLDPSLRKARR